MIEVIAGHRTESCRGRWRIPRATRCLRRREQWPMWRRNTPRAIFKSLSSVRVAIGIVAKSECNEEAVW